MVPPQLTRCCTQPGEAPALGSITCEASPPAIFGCACKIPSRLQIIPNPTRSTARPPPPRPPPPPPPLPPRLAPGRHQPPRPHRRPQQPQERHDEQRDLTLV